LTAGAGDVENFGPVLFVGRNDGVEVALREAP
jgi:hypothetical protein